MRLYCLKRDRGVEQWRHEQPRRQGLRRAARGSRSRVAVSHVVGGVVRRRHAQPEARRDELRGVGQRHSSCSDSAPEGGAARASSVTTQCGRAAACRAERSLSRQSQRTEKSCSRAVERRVDGLERGDVHLERHRQREQRADAHLGLARRESSARRAAVGSRTPSSCSPTAARPAAARPVDARPADLSEAQQLELAAPSPAWSL